MLGPFSTNRIPKCRRLQRQIKERRPSGRRDGKPPAKAACHPGCHGSGLKTAPPTSRRRYADQFSSDGESPAQTIGRGPRRPADAAVAMTRITLDKVGFAAECVCPLLALLSRRLQPALTEWPRLLSFGSRHRQQRRRKVQPTHRHATPVLDPIPDSPGRSRRQEIPTLSRWR